MHWGIAFDTPPTLTPQDPVPVVPALLQRPSSPAPQDPVAVVAPVLQQPSCGQRRDLRLGCERRRSTRGPVHDQVVEIQRGWLELLEGLIETAKEQGELKSETEAGQLAFELYAALELANSLSVLNRDSLIVDRGRAAIRAALASAGKAEADSGV